MCVRGGVLVCLCAFVCVRGGLCVSVAFVCE